MGVSLITDEQASPDAATPGICHLHVHSEYSLLDGAIRIKALLKRVQELGHNAVAMTDHGNLFGAIDFYMQAKKAGVKPIIGAEIFHAGDELTFAAAKACGVAPPTAFHQVLLAKDLAGYKQLIKVVSRGYLEGLTDIPIVPEAVLDEHTSQMIALSACARGEFGFLVTLLRTKSPAGALSLTGDASVEVLAIRTALDAFVDRMRSRYGENFYVELIDNNLAAQKPLLPDLVQVASCYDLPLVCSADAHYLLAEKAASHAVLLGIKHGLTMTTLRGRTKNTHFHLFDNDEMYSIYGAWPEALANTQKIADQCNIEFSFGEYFLPQFETDTDESAEESLQRISREMLEERFEQLGRVYGPSFDDAKRDEYRARLEYELGVILNMGFPGYFLIVQDFINWAKKNDIPVGPGRGSGAGSLVAYALRITDIDPIPYNLIFERFLNPERVSMPDFDVDFCQDRRDEVIDYVTARYGADRVAQITTFGKMNAKAVVRDVGRVLELGYTRVDKIAKLIPDDIGITLAEAMEREPRIMEEAGRDETVADLLQYAKDLEGLSRHTSVHAAGVVICEGPMIDYVPVYTTEQGGLITQFEMKKAETVGLVKFDFLGLKTLTVLREAVGHIHRDKDPDFDLALIPMDDRSVYRDISAGNTVGVFQLESSGMRNLVMKLQPSCFEDVIALVALFRPGPLGSGMVDSFIERKHGREAIDYPLPQLEEILRETYGTILYQEQVMKIAGELASYSLGEADLLRRAMGKKIAAEMDQQKVRFVTGAVDNEIDKTKAEQVFDLMAEFAKYGFNKSHSAAYGLIAYQTAYIKVHYPEQFMAAILTWDLDNTSKVVRYIDDCQRMRIKILPPDINRSELAFDVPGPKQVGFGLSAIKGIGEAPLKPLVEERQRGGPFRNLTDLAKRVNLQRVGKKTLELLNQVGALDSFGIARLKLERLIPDLVKFSDNHHQAQTAGQGCLFGSALDTSSDQGELDLNLTALDLITGPPDTSWLRKEKKLVGVFLTGHPLHFHKEDVRRFSTATLKAIETSIGKTVSIVCVLAMMNERLTKTGSRMANLRLEEPGGMMEAVMFQNELPAEYPEAGSVVRVTGSVDKSYDGTVRFRLERIQPIEDVRRESVKRAHLSLHPLTSQLDNPKEARQGAEALRALTQNFVGETPLNVIIRYPLCDILLDTSETVGVDLSDDFLQRLTRLPFAKTRLIYETYARR